MDIEETGWDRMDSPGTGYGPEAGSCSHGNEPSDSINHG
jgi:hypothetical protein